MVPTHLRWERIKFIRSQHRRRTCRLAARPEPFTLSPRPATAVACPSCFLHLKRCQLKIGRDTSLRRRYQKRFGRAIDPHLPIIHFFELLERLDMRKGQPSDVPSSEWITLRTLLWLHAGATAGNEERKDAPWPDGRYFAQPRCRTAALGVCVTMLLTFLSAVRPDVVTKMVDRIITDAMQCNNESFINRVPPHFHQATKGQSAHSL